MIQFYSLVKKYIMLYILAVSRVNMDCRLKNSEKPGYDGIGGWTASELKEIRLCKLVI